MTELTSNDACIAATQSTNSEQLYRYWESSCDDNSSESQQHVTVAARASMKSEYRVATIAPTRATIDARAQRLARKLASRDTNTTPRAAPAEFTRMSAQAKVHTKPKARAADSRIDRGPCDIIDETHKQRYKV